MNVPLTVWLVVGVVPSLVWLVALVVMCVRTVRS